MATHLRTSDAAKAPLPSKHDSNRMRWVLLGAVCALVIGVYLACAHSGGLELRGSGPQDSYYNLLVNGFRDGHLHLKKEVPPAFAKLTNPYDAASSAPYGLGCPPLHDLSYYQGKFYLYLGVTPAVVLFWPYALVTGNYLSHRDATLIFFSLGFLASAGLVWSMWRRYFAQTPVWVMLAGVVAVGLTNFVPAIAARSDVYEVAISCGYAMTMLALVGIWKALHEPDRRWRWLAAASAAYGLALGARPSLLFGAAILLVPVLAGLRIGKAGGAEGSASEIRPAGAGQSAIRNLLAALGPIALIGIALLAYNAARFGSPLEFGQRYQTPSPVALGAKEQFSLQYLWFNFRVGFLAPAHWTGDFPFVHDIVVPPLPKGYWEVKNAFGVLTNIPLIWLALAAPLAWRGRLDLIGSNLRRFAVAIVLLFAACAFTIGLHDSMCLRYQLEFTDTLVLLAALGVFGLEHGMAAWPAVWRRVARVGWILLLTFSVAFNLLAAVAGDAEYHTELASVLVKKGKVEEGIAQFERVLAAQPHHFRANIELGEILIGQRKLDRAIIHFRKVLEVEPNHVRANMDLGNTLVHMQRVDEAIPCFKRALDERPDYIDAHVNLGMAALLKGKPDEAIAHLQKALEIQPVSAEAHYNLANVLQREGRLEEAVSHYESALKTRPDFGSAHHNLASILFERHDTEGAIGHFQKVVELEPKNMGGYLNLSIALLATGKVRETVAVYEQALTVDPQNVDMSTRLATLLATCPDPSIRNGTRAVELSEQANRLSGGRDLEVLSTLAASYAEAGKFPEAIAAIKQALELASAQNNTALVNELRGHLALYESGSPLRAPR